MSSYAQVTVRRNRDGSVVIITESTDQDPQYTVFEKHDRWDAERMAARAIDLVLEVKP